ncbi:MULTISPECIES: four helix bundle protein [Cloacibacterium]|jgi:four helix bundle protein|uniref:Four helix bundle family protein n=1 Tax=Cloacibacterium normanense TaxID=237258 RepID=A0A1E5UDR3_9FLAO|nr:MULTISPECIES: four helix bundle protein [Cloacibacterium]AZI69302.1 four helix bundle protein [Cloacibacterium normanense]OEL11022.1 four helix bundle family protein [Cloacibacterium normanense]SDO65823.1 four helix bundle protein [Cloacibacterium normanense]
MQNNNLLDRTFKFGVNCIIFLRTLPRDFEYNVIKLQLTKSSTSIGANYEESQAGSSKADFKNKVRISLREARESNYWLRVIKALERSENEQLESLIQESKELKNILASIINNTKL